MGVVLSRERGLVFGALCAVIVAAVFAVNGALGSRAATSGVAGTQATLVNAQSVRVAGTTVVVTRKHGATCFRAPHVSGCASTLAADQFSYATGRVGKRLVIAGVAGSHVRAVIARLSRGGVVWLTPRDGAFYRVLPHGFKLRALVKVLAGGGRVSFAAKS